MLRDLFLLLRLHTPTGWLLLYWPTMWGLLLASQGEIELAWLGFFTFAVILMRSLGCVINDLADRKIDAAVERTKHRPLASGRISVKVAWYVVGVLSIVALLMWWQLPTAAKIWALIAAVFIGIYPFAKRVIACPQAVLGIAFGFGMLVAYSTVSGEFLPHWFIWVCFVANFCWVLAYDTLYAMLDRESDIKLNVKSSAILFGKQDILWISTFYFFFILILSLGGVMAGFGVFYQLGLLLAMALIILFYRFYKGKSYAGCFIVFRTNHWLGALIFAGMLADYHSGVLLT